MSLACLRDRILADRASMTKRVRRYKVDVLVTAAMGPTQPGTCQLSLIWGTAWGSWDMGHEAWGMGYEERVMSHEAWGMRNESWA